MAQNTSYILKDELCKIFTKIPLELLSYVCKDANVYTDVNKSFKIRFIIFNIIAFIIFLLLSYYGFFKKETSILKSYKIIGIILTINIILSIYYTLMTIMEEGKYGMDGEKGFQGEPGETGIMGKLGNTGYIGKVGSSGTNGDIGVMGPKGSTGDTGPRGVRGIRGERGIKGINGYKGKQGDGGVTGKPGLKGDQGPKGEKGNDNKILYVAAKGGDSGVSYPIYTYDSEYQGTKWYEPYPFYNIKDNKEMRNNCDIKNSISYENKTYSECVALCNDEKDERGYLKCVGIYGEIDPNVSSKKGKCFICPERKATIEYVNSNLKVLESANPSSTEAWTNFVTGIGMKTVKDNDSGHVYLSKFSISSKE